MWREESLLDGQPFLQQSIDQASVISGQTPQWKTHGNPAHLEFVKWQMKNCSKTLWSDETKIDLFEWMPGQYHPYSQAWWLPGTSRLVRIEEKCTKKSQMKPCSRVSWPEIGVTVHLSADLKHMGKISKQWLSNHSECPAEAMPDFLIFPPNITQRSSVFEVLPQVYLNISQPVGDL